MSYPQPQDDISLHDYLIVLKRRRWIIAGVFAAVFAAALAYSFLSTPIYRATTTIQIQEKKGPTFTLSPVAAAPMLGQTDPFRTEEEIIKSRTVVEKVVARLGLDKAAAEAADRPVDPQHTVQSLQTKLKIERVRNTNILRISLEDPDPRKAALIINTLADEYINQSLLLVRREASLAREFVGKQLESVRRELDARESALERMKSTKGVVTLADNIKSDLDKLSDVEQRKAVLEMQRRALEALQTSIHGGREAMLSPVLSDNPAIAELSRRLADLHVQRASLIKVYADGHPAIISVNAALEETQSRLRREIANGLQALREQESAFDQIIGRYEGQMKNLPQTEKELVGVMRGLKSTEGIYGFLLQKEQETRIAEASEVENIRIVDPALAPKQPVKPRKAFNLLLGIIVGLLGGVGLAFFREYLDSSVRTPEEAERQIGLPVYGSIYLMASQPAAPAAQDNPYAPFLITQQSPMAAETYKSLRTNIDFMRGEHKVLLLTSVAPGEGKSLTVANMAIMFSVVGLKVLIIDADFRKPAQHTIFGRSRKPGLSDILAGKAAWPSIVQATGFEGLHLLPSGSSTPGSTELLVGRSLDQMFTELREVFDLILIDSPPAGFTDVAILGAKADRLFFVIEAGKTSVRDVNGAKQALVHSKAPLAGLILNKLSGDEARYHYYYYRYYHKDGERASRYRSLVDRVKRAVGRK
ncbi:MAG: polysaccharide biosynthesis tyrosine autokinase [Nitrospirota bacterium]